MTPPPGTIKIYQIVHLDKLPSIIASDCLLADAEVMRRNLSGTTIGMNEIKRRRLEELTLASHPGLHVGECVPFYFCPRSVMLYILHQRNHPDVLYRGGQEPIVHLEADLKKTVAWANNNNLRWAFTLSNAGSRTFEDRANIEQLNEIDWEAVHARTWSGPGIDPAIRDAKQAEFLIEHHFTWSLVERIAVFSRAAYTDVLSAVAVAGHKPQVEIKPEWYY